MSEKILVPVLGESITEATVSKWLKNEGDHIEADEPIVELETDKVTLEVPAATSGILDSLVVSEGATVEVGSLLAIIVAGEKTGQSKTSVPKQENKKIDEQISEPNKDEKNITNNVKS